MYSRPLPKLGLGQLKMNFIRKYRKNTDGNMALFAGLALFTLMAGVAGGTDLIVWQAQKAKLQDAADTAALAGAVKLGKGGNKIEKYVHNEAFAFSKEANDTTLDGFESNVVIDQDAETVEVGLSVEVPRMFSSLFMDTNPSVHAKSVAKVVHGQTSCFYVLDPVSTGAFSTTGSAILNANACRIEVHSTSASAITNSGGATVTADEICIAGGYTGIGYTPPPNTNCSVSADPFVGLVIPAAGLCDYTNLMINIDTALTPGTYCGGIKVSSSAVVTMAPGSYIMKDGSIKISGSASIVGDDLTIVLDTNSSIDISGTGQFITTPPTSGSLEGYSIVQSPTMPLGQISKITGEGQFEFPGIIYMPRMDLEIAGRATGNTYTPSYAAIVTYQLKLAGTGELNITANTDAFNQVVAANITKSSARLIK
jgi:hypothetical protein